MWRVIATLRGRDLAVYGSRDEHTARVFMDNIGGNYDSVRLTFSKMRGLYD